MADETIPEPAIVGVVRRELIRLKLSGANEELTIISTLLIANGLAHLMLLFGIDEANNQLDQIADFVGCQLSDSFDESDEQEETEH